MCSIDHDEYKMGAEASILYGFYIDQRIQCPECKEYLEDERTKDGSRGNSSRDITRNSI